MNIDIVDQSDDTLQFVLEDATPAFANALRRTMLARTPTLAIDEVHITENSSGLFDEVLAHRLGMLSWRFDPEHYKTRAECNCDDGCSQCTVTFALKKDGEDVYADDLKPTDKEVESTEPDTLIVNLLDDQEVDIEADAVLGYGKNHAKWQAALASYEYYPDITVKQDVDKQEAVNEYPDVFEIRDNQLQVTDRDAALAYHRSVDLSDYIEVDEHSNRFVFTVESISGLSPAQIVETAVQTLLNDLETFKQHTT